MPIYSLTQKSTGRVVQVDWPHPPTPEERKKIFSLQEEEPHPQLPPVEGVLQKKKAGDSLSQAEKESLKRRLGLHLPDEYLAVQKAQQARQRTNTDNDEERAKLIEIYKELNQPGDLHTEGQQLATQRGQPVFMGDGTPATPGRPTLQLSEIETKVDPRDHGYTGDPMIDTGLASRMPVKQDVHESVVTTTDENGKLVESTISHRVPQPRPGDPKLSQFRWLMDELGVYTVLPQDIVDENIRRGILPVRVDEKTGQPVRYGGKLTTYTLTDFANSAEQVSIPLVRWADALGGPGTAKALRLDKIFDVHVKKGSPFFTPGKIMSNTHFMRGFSGLMNITNPEYDKTGSGWRDFGHASVAVGAQFTSAMFDLMMAGPIPGMGALGLMKAGTPIAWARHGLTGVGFQLGPQVIEELNPDLGHAVHAFMAPMQTFLLDGDTSKLNRDFMMMGDAIANMLAMGFGHKALRAMKTGRPYSEWSPVAQQELRNVYNKAWTDIKKYSDPELRKTMNDDYRENLRRSENAVRLRQAADEVVRRYKEEGGFEKHLPGGEGPPAAVGLVFFPPELLNVDFKKVKKIISPIVDSTKEMLEDLVQRGELAATDVAKVARNAILAELGKSTSFSKLPPDQQAKIVEQMKNTTHMPEWRADRKKMTVVHYSDRELSVMNPRKEGAKTGKGGEGIGYGDRSREKAWYFFTPEADAKGRKGREPGFGPGTARPVRHTVTGDLALLDVTDPIFVKLKERYTEQLSANQKAGYGEKKPYPRGPKYPNEIELFVDRDLKRMGYDGIIDAGRGAGKVWTRWDTDFKDGQLTLRDRKLHVAESRGDGGNLQNIGNALARFTRDLFKGKDEEGLIEKATDAEKVDRVWRVNRPEILRELNENFEGSQWYRNQLTRGMDILSEVFPELGTDPTAKKMFSAMVAVLSNGNGLELNFRYAIEAYGRYRETGRFPVKRGGPDDKWGVRNNEVEAKFEVLNRMIETYGPEGAIGLLDQRMPARETQTYTGNESQPNRIFGLDEPVYGSFVLGPKLGSFYQNLNGNYHPVTVDKWMARFLRRSLGQNKINKVWDKANKKWKDTDQTPSEVEMRVVQSSVEFIKDRLKEIDPDKYGSLENADVQAAIWAMERSIWEKHGTVLKEGDYVSTARKVVAEYAGGRAEVAEGALGTGAKAGARGKASGSGGAAKAAAGDQGKPEVRAQRKKAVEESKKRLKNFGKGNIDKALTDPTGGIASELAHVMEPLVKQAAKEAADAIKSGGLKAGEATAFVRKRVMEQLENDPQLLSRMRAAPNVLEGEIRKAGDLIERPRLKYEPNPDTALIESEYRALHNEASKPGPDQVLDPARSKEIGDAYEAMRHEPSHPEVKAAYDALTVETKRQYRQMEQRGYIIEVYTGKGEPYATAGDMIKDVRENKHLYILKTDPAGLPKDHPLNAPSGIRDVNGVDLLHNDVFRAVHDFFGHSGRGNSFGPKGEEIAWGVHARMYSPTARRAMTTETRGQNSWVNYRSGLDQSLPLRDRPFAPQKAGLLPEKYSTPEGMTVPEAGPEKIKSAALRMPDGEVIEGASHAEAYGRLEDRIASGELKDQGYYQDMDGFTTNKGRFVTRAEAFKIAEAAEQRDPHYGDDVTSSFLRMEKEEMRAAGVEPQLISEDVVHLRRKQELLYEVGQKIEKTHNEKGGSTFNVKGEEPKDGFMVVTDNTGRVQLNGPTLDRPMGPYVGEQFILDNLSWLEKSPDHYVGTYFDGTKSVVERSTRFKSRKAAIAAAIKNNQYSIWDVKRGKEIVVESKATQWKRAGEEAAKRAQNFGKGNKGTLLSDPTGGIASEVAHVIEPLAKQAAKDAGEALQSGAIKATEVASFMQKKMMEAIENDPQLLSKLRTVPGGTAPERVLSINLDRMEIPESAKQEIRKVTEEVGKLLEEKGEREPITAEEVQRAAITAEPLSKVLTRKQSLAMQASMLKSRELLAQLANKELTPDEVKQMKTESMKVAQMARLFGQLLNSLKIKAGENGYDVYDGIRQQVAERLLSRGKSMEELVALMDQVNDWGNPKEVAEFLGRYDKRSFKEDLDMFRYINMLSSPLTHMVNAISNFTQVAFLAPSTRMAWGGTDWVASKLTGSVRENYSSSVPPYYRGVANALPTAVSRAVDALMGRTFVERPDIGMLPPTGKASSPLGLPIAKFNKTFHFVLRALEAGDVLFRELATAGEFEAIAHNAKKNGLSVNKEVMQAMKEAAHERGKYWVFRAKPDPLNATGQGDVLSTIDKFTRVVMDARRIKGVSWIIPFVQTPMNIFKQGVEYTPGLGLTTLVGNKSKAEQLAKQVVGSTVYLGAAWAIMQYDGTWSVPDDPKERNRFYSEGKQPFSIKLPGVGWVSYEKLGPLAFPMAIAAATRHTVDNVKGDPTKAIDEIGKSLANTLEFFSSQSYVRGLADFVDATRGKSHEIGRLLASFPQQVVPMSSMQRWVTRMIDPEMKDSDGMFERMKAGTPGLSEDITPHRDIFGDVSEDDRNILNALIPIKTREDKTDKDPIWNLMREADYFPSSVSKTTKNPNTGEPFSKTQLDRYKELYGKELRRRFNNELGSLTNRNPEKRAERMKKLESLAKETAKKELMKEINFRGLR